MRTTIDLPEAIYQTSCEAADSDNIPLNELIETLLTREFNRRTRPNFDDDLVDWREELLD